jgi:hypothetical protein
LTDAKIIRGNHSRRQIAPTGPDILDLLGFPALLAHPPALVTFVDGLRRGVASMRRFWRVGVAFCPATAIRPIPPCLLLSWRALFGTRNYAGHPIFEVAGFFS